MHRAVHATAAGTRLLEGRKTSRTPKAAQHFGGSTILNFGNSYTSERRKPETHANGGPAD